MSHPLRSAAPFKIDLVDVICGPCQTAILNQILLSEKENLLQSIDRKNKATPKVVAVRQQQEAAAARKQRKAAAARKQLEAATARKQQKAAAARKEQEAAAARKKQKAEAARKQQEAEAARKQQKAEAARKQQEAEAASKQQKAAVALKQQEAIAARKQLEAETALKQREAESARQQQYAASTPYFELCEVSKDDAKEIHTTVVYVDGSLRDPVAGVGVAFVDVRMQHLNLSLRLSGNQHTSGTAEVAAAEQVVTIVRSNWELFKKTTQSIVIRSDHSGLVEAMQSKNYTWKMGNLYEDLAKKIAELMPLKVTFEHVLKANHVKEHIEAHNLAGEASCLKGIRASPVRETKVEQQNTVLLKVEEKKREQHQKSSLPVTVSKEQKSQSVIPPVTVSKKQKKQNIIVEEKIIEQKQIKFSEPEILIQPCSLSSPTTQGGRIMCEYRTAIRNNDWLAESYSQLHV